MNFRKAMIPAVFAAAVGTVATLGFVGTSGAQNAPVVQTTKVAIVNPGKVFQEMLETKDLIAKMESERTVLAQQEQEKRRRLEDLQGQRNLLRPDSPQFEEKDRELAQAAIEFQAWGQLTQARLQRMQKVQTRNLFDKIQAATAQVAAQRGYDLVLADQRQDLPPNIDGIDLNQLKAVLNQRNVLYAAPAFDITSEVTAALDTMYKTSGGGAAAPAPAPVTPAPAAPAAPATPR